MTYDEWFTAYTQQMAGQVGVPGRDMRAAFEAGKTSRRLREVPGLNVLVLRIPGKSDQLFADFKEGIRAMNNGPLSATVTVERAWYMENPYE